MSATEKELVQMTWKELVPVADAVAELFYRKLFDVDPEIMLLFKGDMKERGRKLTDMITFAVYGLDIMETIIYGKRRERCRPFGGTRRVRRWL